MQLLDVDDNRFATLGATQRPQSLENDDHDDDLHGDQQGDERSASLDEVGQLRTDDESDHGRPDE
jgi:hypothetical protein